MENATSILQQIALRQRYVGDVLETKWNNFLDIVGDDDQTLWIWGTTIVIVIIYWCYAALFTVMDITNRPKFLRKYKIQPGMNEPVDNKKLMSAIWVVLKNQTIVTIPTLYVAYHGLFKSYNTAAVRVLPSFPILFRDLIIFIFVEEIMFYYGHRLLHHKSLYKYVHKKHHEWTAPIAAITFYCHPLEHILTNMLPVGISVALTKAHILSAWIFITLAIVNAMTDHTGYYFPYSASSVRFHDYHHAKFNYNFGVLGWLDKLHGTFKEMPVMKKSATSNGVKNITNGKFKANK